MGNRLDFIWVGHYSTPKRNTLYPLLWPPDGASVTFRQFRISIRRTALLNFVWSFGPKQQGFWFLPLWLNYVEPRLARQPWFRHSKCQKVWEILGRRVDGFDGVDGTWLGHYIDSDMVIRFIKKFPCASCWCFMQVMNIAERSKFPSSAAVLIRAQNQRRNFDALLMKQLFDERLYHPAVNASPPLQPHRSLLYCIL